MLPYRVMKYLAAFAGQYDSRLRRASGDRDGVRELVGPGPCDTATSCTHTDSTLACPGECCGADFEI